MVNMHIIPKTNMLKTCKISGNGNNKNVRGHSVLFSVLFWMKIKPYAIKLNIEKTGRKTAPQDHRYAANTKNGYGNL